MTSYPRVGGKIASTAEMRAGTQKRGSAFKAEVPLVLATSSRAAHGCGRLSPAEFVER